MFFIILSLPLTAAVFTSFFAKNLGRQGVQFLSCFFMFLSFCLACFLFNSIFFYSQVFAATLFCWISLGCLDISWSFYFDSLAASLLLVITLISFFVHIYSCSYINNDPHISRFISYLSLFSFFIIVLVTANNLVQIFVGWEGVGLCSYLLINFWLTRLQANKAAVKAIVVNRVGDFGLVAGMLFIFFFSGSLSYSTLFAYNFEACFPIVYCFGTAVSTKFLVSLFLFIGVIGKSAQLGLHIWLPDAIEGPTPVSALIHAATIVTAGVFLLARLSSVFEISAFFLQIISFFGACTAFFGASTGIAQHDLKKIIAYSTCSQLGYIVFSCGLSSYSAGIFHLVNHAFFKALLFLTAGAIIHAINDEQDVRKMGRLFRILPFSYLAILIGSLALGGFPFFSGFYSKDAILELALIGYTDSILFCAFFGCLAAFCTAYYSSKLIIYTFFSEVNSQKKIIEKAHEPSLFIALPLFVLMCFSVFWGFIMRDLFYGPGSFCFSSSLFYSPSNFFLFESEFLFFFFKLVPFFCSFVGALLFLLLFKSAFFVYFYKQNIIRFFFVFFNKKWFFDKIVSLFISQVAFKLSLFATYKELDRGFLELVGPTGFFQFQKNNFYTVTFLIAGQLYHYFFFYFFAFVLFSSFFFYFQITLFFFMAKIFFVLLCLYLFF